MNDALDGMCNYLADHPWTTLAMLFCANLFALCADVVLP